MSNKELYEKVPEVADTVKQKRLKLAGHRYRHPDEAASNLVLWTPFLIFNSNLEYTLLQKLEKPHNVEWVIFN